MEKTIEGKVLAMEIVLTPQSEAIVKAIMASGDDDPALIIKEALRYFHEVKSTAVLDDAEELGTGEALESLENFSLTDLSERQQLKLYPYDEQARQEDEAAYQECLAMSFCLTKVTDFIISGYDLTDLQGDSVGGFELDLGFHQFSYDELMGHCRNFCKKEQARLDWARQVWARLKSQAEHY